MALEQIAAINNSMSMLANLFEYASGVESLNEYTEYTNTHVKALKDANVDNCIIEHFESLCNACLPFVKETVRKHEEYEKRCQELYEIEPF